MKMERRFRKFFSYLINLLCDPKGSAAAINHACDSKELDWIMMGGDACGNQK